MKPSLKRREKMNCLSVFQNKKHKIARMERINDKRSEKGDKERYSTDILPTL